jgi:hypothetical protein
MKRLTLIGIGLIFILPILACGPSAEPTNTPEPPPMPTNTPLPPPTATNTPLPQPTATNTPEPFVGGDCDPISDRVEMNTSVDKSVQGGSYPDACEVFCLWVPDGSRLEIGISDFNVDLDIYVDVDLTVLQYEDHGRWESNAYGSVNEEVRINNPEGRYYMQVCSYEGLPSSFTLWNDFTP